MADGRTIVGVIERTIARPGEGSDTAIVTSGEDRTRRPGALDILYVGTLPPHPGGSGVVGAQLLSGLAKLGHAVRAVAPITAEALAAGDQFAASHPEIAVARFEVPFFDVSSGGAVSDRDRRHEGDEIGAQLPGLVSQRRPDVVVIGRKRFAWHVPEVARAHSLPTVLLFHSSTTADMLGTRDRGRRERLRDQYRKVDLIVVVAEHLAGDVQRVGLHNFTVIPNGVDLRAFSPRPKDAALLRRLDLRDDKIVVVHVSNLKDVKRPLDIVSSAIRVLRTRPEVVYVIVGDGPARAAMEARCRQQGIRDSFRLVGWVEHERVPAYLNLADIVVMPSETEGQALVYLEAQACGRLLLASDIPAAREVIRDGETGILFQKGDVEDLAAQTLRAAEDAELRAAIGRQARAWVKSHDVDRTVAAYEQALRGVASQARP